MFFWAIGFWVVKSPLFKSQVQVLQPNKSTISLLPKTKTTRSKHIHHYLTTSLPSFPLSDLRSERLMLRPPSRFAGATVLRWFSTCPTAAPAVSEAEELFKDSWKKVVPHIDPPKTPLSFVQPRSQNPTSIPPKLTLNLHLPHSSDLFNEEVDMVTLPATTGQMGVLPGHVATMTELKPGTLLLHQANETTKYFVSGGFAFIYPNSVADIITLEAVPVDRIDPNMVEKGLAEFSQKLSSATTDYEKAEAQVGVDVHNALQSALTG